MIIRFRGLSFFEKNSSMIRFLLSFFLIWLSFFYRLMNFLDLLKKKKKNKDHSSLFFFSFSFDQAFENALHYLIMQT